MYLIRIKQIQPIHEAVTTSSVSYVECENYAKLIETWKAIHLAFGENAEIDIFKTVELDFKAIKEGTYSETNIEVSKLAKERTHADLDKIQRVQLLRKRAAEKGIDYNGSDLDFYNMDSKELDSMLALFEALLRSTRGKRNTLD